MGVTVFSAAGYFVSLCARAMLLSLAVVASGQGGTI